MLKKVLKKILLFIFVINLNLFNYDYNVQAKEQINFKNITIEDGLTQGTVEALFQDSKGYIWIGTNDGLSRYNGYQFKNYRIEEDREHSLVNNYILDINEDESGNIWVATANGLSKIHKDGKTITNYLANSNKGNLSNSNTNAILITRNNEILIGTGDGLNIYDKESDTFKEIFEGDRLAGRYIETLVEDNEGNIWVGTYSGVSKINLTSGESKHFLTSKDSNLKSEDEIYKVYYDFKGYIWVGTKSRGACKIDIKTNEITRYRKNENALGGDFIKSFLRDSSGNMWIATDGGLSKYDDKSDSFTTYVNKIYDRNSLVDNSIYSIIQDRTGLIWIGTYAGISIFNPESEIQHYKNDPFDEKTISDNMISALYEDDEGQTWIGTKYNGIDILNKDKDKIKNINSKNYENLIPSDNVFDIVGNGNYIFVSTDKGVTIIDKKNNNSKTYDKNDGIPNNVVKSLLYDDLGYLWIGTTDGLAILNLKTEEITDISDIVEKYSPNDRYIEDIYKDKDGEYWIATFIQGGLLRINPHTKKAFVYKNIEDNNESISNDSIRTITEGENGEMWIGTSFGLNKFNKDTEKFKRYTTNNGMENNTIYGILIDLYGNPWCSTNMGISKLNIYNDTIVNFDITDGLQSNEFNGNAYFKNRSGELIFGGINGLNIINPENIKNNEDEYELIFTEFKINGVKVDNLNKERLQSYENNVYIEVFIPIYKNVNGIQYYYQLEGSNDEWIPMDKNSITLSNLSPGNYVFKIRARYNNGIISDESKIEFKINPPFWASKYAICIYILSVILFLIYNKNKVKRLDNIVDLRTKELYDEMERNNQLFEKVIKLERSKNSYLINLSHELRTPLNVIYSTEQLIRELNKDKHGIDKNKLDKYMLIMRNNTKRLLKIINDLIDTSKIEHGSYNIDIEKVDIVYIVEEAALSLREYIEEKGIELIIDPEIEEKIIEADGNEIERCIVNIVSNAYKFTNAGGYIRVDIKDLGNNVRIEISDNGIGIDKKHHDLIFNRFNQIVDPNAEVKKGSGLGLTITKKIIDMHQGSIYVESELGKGSKFIIILPTSQRKN